MYSLKVTAHKHDVASSASVNVKTHIHTGEITSKHQKEKYRPYLCLQVQDHSESAPHKNEQSSTCLSQVYEPTIAETCQNNICILVQVAV